MDRPDKQIVHESDSGEVSEDRQCVNGSKINQELDYSAGKVDGSSIGLEELTLDVLTVRSSSDS